MKCSHPGCPNPAKSKGLCKTHYRYKKVKDREEALRYIIRKAEAIKSRRPDLAEILDELTALARPLFREFQPKKMSPSEELAAVRAELAELRKAIQPSKGKKTL